MLDKEWERRLEQLRDLSEGFMGSSEADKFSERYRKKKLKVDQTFGPLYNMNPAEAFKARQEARQAIKDLEVYLLGESREN